MTRLRLTVLATVLLAALLAGCAQRPTLRVGYLDGQADSELMAQIVAETLRRADARPVLVACADLLECGRRLQAGDLDLLPEYSGSTRAFLRTRDIEAGRLAAVRDALEDFGMTVSDGFGFSAPYRLLVRREAADAAGLATIEDLGSMAAPRFVVPPGYTRQPGDGLLALARRYGLDIAPDAVAEVVSPAERLARLLDGRADVAVIRAPYVAEDAEVAALSDPLNFFPAYEAAAVIASPDPDRRAFIREALAPLTGRLTGEAVQPLIREIVLQGRSPDLLARQLLVRIGLIDASRPTLLRPEMTIAVPDAEDLEPQTGRALLTIRRAFPDRPVTPQPTTSPLAALERGQAELAVLHVSDFFDIGWNGQFRGRDWRAEAIAVLGRRDFLLLTRTDAKLVGGNPLSGEVGIPPGWTSGGRVAARMLTLAGRVPDLRAPGPELIAALKTRRIDTAIVLLSPQSRQALQTINLAKDRIRAASLVPWLVSAPFFLNETRLAQSPVPGQETPIDTYSMQVVLAGPAPRGRVGPVHGGPASAVATRNLPLPLREAEALARAAETAELPDPVIPSFRDRGAELARQAGPESQWIETALVVIAIAFMAWAGYLLAQPSRRWR